MCFVIYQHIDSFCILIYDLKQTIRLLIANIGTFVTLVHCEYIVYNVSAAAT